MATVRDLLKAKKVSSIFSVTPSASVLDAMRLMAEHNVGAMLVMDGGRIAGVISERDVVRKVDLAGKSSDDLLVRDIMTEKVLYVEAHQSLEECMALMTEKHIRHLPVLENERLLGVVSIGDVLREVIHEQKFIINQLEHYISGGGKQ
jgi:CBS domain-containing protein